MTDRIPIGEALAGIDIEPIEEGWTPLDGGFWRSGEDDE